MAIHASTEVVKEREKKKIKIKEKEEKKGSNSPIRRLFH